MTSRPTDTIILRLVNLSPKDATLEMMADYLRALQGVLADIKGITFDKVKSGSAQLQMKATSDAQAETALRLVQLQNGQGTQDQQKYYEALRKQNLRYQTKATLKIARKTVSIPSIDPTIEGQIITDETEIDAKIVKLGGLDASIPMTAITPNGERINCNANLALARDLRQYLLEPVYLSLGGIGTWKKMLSGNWALTSLDVKTYALSPSDGIEDFAKISELAGSKWGEESDPFETLRKLQGKRSKHDRS